MTFYLSFYLLSSLLYNMHFNRPLNCWSLRCSWSITYQRCSNYIFILHLTLGFNILCKDNCKPRREPFKFWDLVASYIREFTVCFLDQEYVHIILLHHFCNYISGTSPEIFSGAKNFTTLPYECSTHVIFTGACIFHCQLYDVVSGALMFQEEQILGLMK